MSVKNQNRTDLRFKTALCVKMDDRRNTSTEVSDDGAAT